MVEHQFRRDPEEKELSSQADRSKRSGRGRMHSFRLLNSRDWWSRVNNVQKSHFVRDSKWSALDAAHKSPFTDACPLYIGMQ